METIVVFRPDVRHPSPEEGVTITPANERYELQKLSSKNVDYIQACPLGFKSMLPAPFAVVNSLLGLRSVTGHLSQRRNDTHVMQPAIKPFPAIALQVY